MTTSLQEILNKLWSGKEVNVQPQVVLEALKKCASILTDGNQHDGHEALVSSSLSLSFLLAFHSRQSQWGIETRLWIQQNGRDERLRERHPHFCRWILEGLRRFQQEFLDQSLLRPVMYQLCLYRVRLCICCTFSLSFPRKLPNTSLSTFFIFLSFKKKLKSPSMSSCTIPSLTMMKTSILSSTANLSRSPLRRMRPCPRSSWASILNSTPRTNNMLLLRCARTPRDTSSTLVSLSRTSSTTMSPMPEPLIVPTAFLLILYAHLFLSLSLDSSSPGLYRTCLLGQYLLRNLHWLPNCFHSWDPGCPSAHHDLS